MYSLRKCRHHLRDYVLWFKKHADSLDAGTRASIDEKLRAADQASLAGDRESADRLMRELEQHPAYQKYKTWLAYLFEVVLALVIALAIATLVRQMWFEPYKIPTGSMRPTFLEQDHLIVSKTSLGLNVPLQPAHFYFNPELVRRGCVVIWSGDGVDLPDTNTVYFWLFPGKKRYIKRCVGLPGDSLYFYGGRLWGVDKNGNDISSQLQVEEMKDLDYVPMSSFSGRIESTQLGRDTPVYRATLKHFNVPLGRFAASSYGVSDGEIHVKGEWVRERLAEQLQSHSQPVVFNEFLGMNHFAMARLITRQELKAYTSLDVEEFPEAPLYLELHHHPNLTQPKPRIGHSYRGMFRVYLEPEVSAIPLNQEHIDAIMRGMYTIRFTIQNGFASAWSIEGTPIHTGSPEFSQVPDGTYEFYHGKGYHVGWGGIRSELPADHPLYARTAENVQRLFNLGIEVDTDFQPFSREQISFPSRYAYYRSGDLYLMGAKVMDQSDSTLAEFVEQEHERQQAASDESDPYIAFVDRGPPLVDGKIDVEFIRNFGVTVPEKQYMVLGDNHARSADSRTFGFVPQANLEGTPLVIIWPPGPRIGVPNIPMTPWFTLPRAIVWGVIFVVVGIWWVRERRLMNKPLL